MSLLLIGCNSEENNNNAQLSNVQADNIEITETETISGNSISETKNIVALKTTANTLKDTEISDNAEIDEKKKEYEVTEYEEAVTMYAIGAVNVRKGPGKKYSRLGTLNVGESVEVLGETSNKWKEIKYNNVVAFVSGSYLQNEQVDLQETEQTIANSENSTQNDVEVQQSQTVATVQPHAAGIIFVGDSRFVQMHEAVGDDGNVWICQNSKGYAWLESTALERINNNVGSGTKIIINLGVNDPGNWRKYADLINANITAWNESGATVYYALVGPVWENPYTTDEQVKNFNNSIIGVLSPSVQVLDEYNYLVNSGYRLVDGLHYDSNTYLNIYSYYLTNVG